MAPEMLSFLDSETGERVDAFRLLDWTNVWGIGMIMLAIVNGQDLVHQLTYLPGTQLEPQVTTAALVRYSAQLCHLVTRCLCWEPQKRISSTQLWAAIRTLDLSNDRPGYHAYIKAARAGHQEISPYDLDYPQDEYRLGLARDSWDATDVGATEEDTDMMYGE